MYIICCLLGVLASDHFWLARLPHTKLLSQVSDPEGFISTRATCSCCHIQPVLCPQAPLLTCLTGLCSCRWRSSAPVSTVIIMFSQCKYFISSLFIRFSARIRSLSLRATSYRSLVVWSKSTSLSRLISFSVCAHLYVMWDAHFFGSKDTSINPSPVLKNPRRRCNMKLSSNTRLPRWSEVLRCNLMRLCLFTSTLPSAECASICTAWMPVFW